MSPRCYIVYRLKQNWVFVHDMIYWSTDKVRAFITAVPTVSNMYVPACCMIDALTLLQVLLVCTFHRNSKVMIQLWYVYCNRFLKKKEFKCSFLLLLSFLDEFIILFLEFSPFVIFYVHYLLSVFLHTLL